MVDPRPVVPGPVSPVRSGSLAAAASIVAMWSYTGVVTPGMWTFVVFTVIMVILLAGVLSRSAFGRLPGGIRDPLTLFVQVVVAIAACTRMLVGETALFGLWPTATSVQLIGLRVSQSVEEITAGVAPLPASLPLATTLGLAFAVVAILIDHLVAHRMAVLAAMFTSVVGVMPMLLSYGSVNIVWFLLQAVIILLLLRFAARRDRPTPGQASPVMAVLTGALAIALTVIATPALPLTASLPGAGPQLTVRADLRLGDDLRRPEGVEALTLVTSADSPPYLRLATLSRFDGDVWRPDRSERQNLIDGFGEPEWSEPIKTVEHQASIRVLGVSSDLLPVPYAAVKVTGVGDDWKAMPLNRTVVTGEDDASGADYTVKTVSAAPTLEQIRAARAEGAARLAPTVQDLPPIIAETARQVTADATTDYDRLIALQNWFRSDFAYSLDAPVEQDFDGTGADAVATFLQKRTGYCIHFAGAFALMAQTMDMPVRIVVGYLPGTATDVKRGDDIVYSVTSDQLHSWPEVFFDGIGWVPFEPTATLGEPTAFVAAAAGSGSGEAPEAPQPSAAPSSSASAAPSAGPDRRDEDQGGTGADGLRRLDPTPVALVALGILLVALLPALVRRGRRMLRLSRARRGDAMAAWRELTDTMVDLGLPVHDAQTARIRAQALADARGVDATALDALVRAVEQRSYARSGTDAGDLAVPLRVVLARLERDAERRRLVGALLPASLLAR